MREYQKKRGITSKSVAGKRQRVGTSSVARTRGAAVTGEMKYFDCNLEASAIPITAATWPAGAMMDPATTINLGAAAVATPLALVVPTVGAGLNQRVGRKITVRKIKVHGTIAVPVQAAQGIADSATKIRLALVQDCQTNAAQMAAADLYNGSTSAVSTLLSFQNPNNFGRFRVLKDKMLTIGNLNMAGSPTAADVIQAGQKVSFKFNVNFKTPVTVHFNATNGGTVADIVDNSFHIVCAADNTAYAPVLTYYSRVCYKDV